MSWPLFKPDILQKGPNNHSKQRHVHTCPTKISSQLNSPLPITMPASSCDAGEIVFISYKECHERVFDMQTKDSFPTCIHLLL